MFSTSSVMLTQRRGAEDLVEAFHEPRLLGRRSPLNGSLGEFVRGDVLEADRTAGHLRPSLIHANEVTPAHPGESEAAISERKSQERDSHDQAAA
jgi:hypothetical protein